MKTFNDTDEKRDYSSQVLVTTLPVMKFLNWLEPSTDVYTLRQYTNITQPVLDENKFNHVATILVISGTTKANGYKHTVFSSGAIG